METPTCFKQQLLSRTSLKLHPVNGQHISKLHLEPGLCKVLQNLLAGRTVLAGDAFWIYQPYAQKRQRNMAIKNYPPFLCTIVSFIISSYGISSPRKNCRRLNLKTTRGYPGVPRSVQRSPLTFSYILLVPERIWLVVPTSLKNISQLGWFFPIYGKIKIMFQTTNQERII